MGPTSANFDWFSLVKEGGAYCAPLLLGAIMWLVKENKAKDAKIESLSERLITVAMKLGDIFNENRGRR